MQRLEVSGAVRPIYGSLGVKRLKRTKLPTASHFYEAFCCSRLNKSSPKFAQQLQMAASVPSSDILPDNTFIYFRTRKQN